MNYKKHKQYRLKGFDYSGEGNYFVTICTQNRCRYFGEIKNEKMILSDSGIIVQKTWKEIPIKFENVKLDACQVMPDHFHGIINLKSGNNGNIINDVPTNRSTNISTNKSGIKNNPMESDSITLGKIIRWFKGRVTFEIKKIIPDFAWQPRYHDRIIRGDNEFYFIREYIENNPVNYGKGIIKEYFRNTNYELSK